MGFFQRSWDLGIDMGFELFSMFHSMYVLALDNFTNNWDCQKTLNISSACIHALESFDKIL